MSGNSILVNITSSVNKRWELIILSDSVSEFHSYSHLWHVDWDILWTVVVGLLSTISSMTSSLSTAVYCTGCSVVGFRNSPFSRKYLCTWENTCQSCVHWFGSCLVFSGTCCCIPITDSINNILFVSTNVHFENMFSYNYASSEHVPNCLLIVSYSCLEILTLTTSYVH